jgi:hypothetical protein
MEAYMFDLLEEFKKENPDLNVQQVFSGWVNDIYDDVYSVNLEDHTGTEDLVAEIFQKNFPEGKVEIGTIFYWYLGEDKNGEGFSQIRLSTAIWTQEQIDRANEDAEVLLSLFAKKE